MIKSHTETPGGSCLEGREVEGNASPVGGVEGMRFAIRGMSWVSRGALLRLGCCLPSGELTPEVCWENPVPCDNQSDSCLVFSGHLE